MQGCFALCNIAPYFAFLSLMLRTLNVLFTFYKTFLLPSLLANAFCWGMVYEYGSGPVALLLPFKLFVTALIVAYIHEYSYSRYYYYHNLGISKAMLWGVTLGFDFAFYMLCLILLCTR